MIITDIRLQSFRSYKDSSFELSPGVNIIVGPNASGKTNLLEALLLTCVGRSYRAKDGDLVSFDAPWARIDVDTPDGSRVVKIVTDAHTTQKTFIIGGKDFKRLSMQKSIPVVLFEPNHLLLFTGSPDRRREYMDTILEQTTPGYGVLLRNYRRTLAQRNALLKQDYPRPEQLFVWNLRLSQLGGQVVGARTSLVAHLTQRIDDLYRKLVNGAKAVSIAYVGSCNTAQYSSDMLHKLERGFSLDVQRGFTAYGPHRDDMHMYIDGHAMEDAASRGETRTLLLALKILEADLLEDVRQQKPVLLLDDVFSELDGARRRALTAYLSSHQTFITTTDADVVVRNFTQTCSIIAMERT